MVKVSRSSKRVKPGTLAIGVDVSKHFHVVAGRTPEGAEVAASRFEADRRGFEGVKGYIEEARQEVGASAVRIGMESTGHYGAPLQEYLEGEGYPVVFVNPAHTKRVKELEDNSPEKNDTKDAGLIAGLVVEGRYVHAGTARGVFAQLRVLGAHREDLVEEKTRLLNRLQAYVDRVFPEFGGIFSDLGTRGARAALGVAVTPEQFVEAGVARLRRVVAKASRRRRKADEQAQALVEAAARSVGVEEGREALCRVIADVLEALDQVEARLEAVEEAIGEEMKAVEYSERLVGVPRLGAMTVAVILGQAGDLGQYRRAEEPIKVAGLNLWSTSSGTSKGSSVRISKRGRPLLRRVLFMAALRMVGRGGPFEQRHAAWCARGKPKIAGIVAQSRRLLRILFAMVRDGSTFQAAA